ncbi:MAG TPA: hypothetical protein VHR45_21930 [Thermoanaerobaculia bacterium]|nr:hypothetical protein [Thermoanaerobaculia bacterium]
MPPTPLDCAAWPPAPAQTEARRPALESWRLALAAAAYTALAAFYLRPIWRLFASHIAPGGGDPLFNLYLLKWVAHEAHRGFGGFWDPPFFFPEHGVLAFSDHLLGPGLAAAAFTSLVPSWVAAYNFLFLFSFAASGAAACYVLRRGGASWAAAWLGGAMYAFSPFRWEQLPHLQILLMQWIPVTLWSFDRLLERPSGRRAGIFLLFYLLHATGGCYLAYMIHPPLLVLLLNRLPGLRRRAAWRAELPLLAGTALAAAAIVVAIFGRYWQAAAGGGLGWGADKWRYFGATLLSYLAPSHLNFYSGIWPSVFFRPENALFPGWLAGGLGAVGLFDLWRHYRRPPPAPLPGTRRLACAGLLLLALAGVLAAELCTLGLPVRWFPSAGDGYGLPLLLIVLGGGGWLLLRRRWLGGWPLRWSEIEPWPRGLLAAGAVTAALSSPLFFVPAVRLLPGLAAMRVPARFDACTSLVIAWLACSALDRRLALGRAGGAGGAGWRAAPPGRIALIAPAALIAPLALIGVGALLVIDLAPHLIHWVPLPEEGDFPAVYSWIAGQPDVHALLEIPLVDPALPAGELVDVIYMYYGTRHWKPLVNGYSAHFPPRLLHLRETCCSPLPDRAAVAELRRWGVSHLLVHRARLPPRQRLELDRWQGDGELQLLYAADGDLVFRVQPSAAPQAASAARVIAAPAGSRDW